MIELENISAWGTEVGSEKPIRLDEISILTTPTMIRSLGAFLINAAFEMEKNEIEHIHLQDLSSNFSQTNHIDIILINQNMTKQTRADKAKT